MLVKIVVNNFNVTEEIIRHIAGSQEIIMTG
jgi:hypothetical protein